MSPLLRRRFAVLVSILLLMVWSTIGLAGNTQEDAARAAARSAGYEGIKAFQSGDMPVAVDKLGRAFSVVKVPTLGLWYARALAKTGNLVEASERYAEVIRLEIIEGKVKEQKEAQAEATAEFNALQPRIPSLTWSVQGASNDCAVTLDGSPVPMNLMGLATPINPGTHRIEAKQGAALVEQTVTLAEGEKKSIELKLAAPEAPAAAAAPVVPGAPGALVAPGAPENKDSAQRPTAVYVSAAATGVFAVAATVSGILTLSKQSTFDDAKARGDRAAAQSASDSGKTLALVTDISIGATVIGAGVTTYLLLSSSPKSVEKAPAPAALGFAPTIGRQSVGLGLSGSF